MTQILEFSIKANWDRNKQAAKKVFFQIHQIRQTCKRSTNFKNGEKAMKFPRNMPWIILNVRNPGNFNQN